MNKRVVIFLTIFSCISHVAFSSEKATEKDLQNAALYIVKGDLESFISLVKRVKIEKKTLRFFQTQH